MTNSGQACVGVERVYVESAVYDEFVALVTAKVKALRQGDGRAGQLRLRYRRHGDGRPGRHRDRSRERCGRQGRRILCGGEPGTEGNFFEPTVLVDVDHSMTCMREETFGPTLAIMRVADARRRLPLPTTPSTD